MSKQKQFKLPALVLAAVSATLFTAAASASIHYNFTAAANSISSGSSVGNDSFSFSSQGYGDSGPNVTVSGWANIDTTGGVSGDNRLIDQANVRTWSGLGVEYSGEGGSPQHSTDNSGAFDMVLLSFAEDIELNGLSVGWRSNDSDMSVFAYTGPDAFNTSSKLEGLRYNQLVSEGWEVVDHVANVTLDSTPSTTADGTITSVSNTGVSSSYWLVGAYNWLADGDTSLNHGSGWADYVKISAVTGKITNNGGGGNGGHDVPEPSTILLLALGLMAVWYYKRRDSNMRSDLRHALSC